MRRILIVVVAAAACAIGVAACSGGGGGGASGHGELHTGDYIISNFVVPSDACGLGFDPMTANGATFTITVANGTLSFPITQAGDLASGPYSAGVFNAKYHADIDLSPNYDCVLTEDYGFAGASTAVDAADAAETIKLTVKSGAACAQFATENLAGTVTFPCTSKDTQHIALTQGPPPPEDVTGTVTTSTGYGTTLSNDYNNEDTTSTLTASVTASGLNFTLDPGENFQCYSPAATSSNYYELATYDAVTYVLHVDSNSWMAGSVALGSTNTLTLDMFDAAGDELVAAATGGNAMLGAAPLTTTGACSFSMTNVPISGQLYKVAAFAPQTHRVRKVSLVENRLKVPAAKLQH